LGTQTAMEQSFGSACHGAGRQMSRSEARRRVQPDELRTQLAEQHIAVQAGSMAGLAEEAPLAYKDVDAVVNVVHAAGLATKVARTLPLAVMKG
ncbi:MAG: RtcB family protein, partial [Anaerolineae bacterium]